MFIPKDADRFAKIAGDVQSVVVIVAVLVGGGWTLYSFNATRAIERAAIELELAKAQKPMIDISIEVKGAVGADPSNATEVYTFIQAVVTLKNVGNTPADVDLHDETLFIGEVNSSRGQLVADEGLTRLHHLTTLNYRRLSVPPGNSVRIPYLTSANPGFYFVEFRLPWPKGADGIGGAVAGVDDQQRYAVISAFVDVPSAHDRLDEQRRRASVAHTRR